MNNLRNPEYLEKFRCFRMFAAISVLIVIFLSACGKKVETDAAVTSPVKIVILPFNAPQDANSIGWAALAAPILMAKTGLHAQDLEMVPIWQSMPYALENAGASRTFTPDAAANVANWVSAKWAIMGEVTPTKTGISMIVDFIPTRSSMVPFRFLKKGKIDDVGNGIYDAYNQFLRYLVARPLPQPRKTMVALSSMKELAETLNREYGWFTAADPGKASASIKQLMGSDEQLVRSLFSPITYPELSEKK